MFFIFYAIIFPIAMVLVLKYAVKIQIRRFNELSQNKNFIEYRYEFKDNNINILNRTTFSNINIPYDNIKNWKESENFLVITTKSHMALIIYKNEANEYDLKEFLRDKCKRGK